MRLKLTIFVAAMIIVSALSVFAWNTVMVRPVGIMDGPVPSRLQRTVNDDLLMSHIGTLSAEQGPGLLYSGDYWIQVNEDGFGGTAAVRAKRAQAMFLYPFQIDGKTWFYCGVEGVNHAEIWRTDGSSAYPPVLDWTDATDNSVFGYPNKAADFAIEWNGDLYVGTRNEQGTAILRYYDQGGGSWKWVQVNVPGFGKTYTDGEQTRYMNTHTRAMAIFTAPDNQKECLYIGTFNGYSGCEVWRTDGTLAGDQDYPERMVWEQVNYGGFGSGTDEPDNICVMDMIVFDGGLYAGTYNWNDSKDPDYDDETDWSAGRAFRFAPESDSKNWDMVWDGVISGAGTDTDPYCYALAARCFAIFGSKLWVGLFHSSGDDFFNTASGDSGAWTGAGRVEDGFPNDLVALKVYDGHLWTTAHRSTRRFVFRSPDGENWEQRSTNGFGDDYNKSLYCFGNLGDDLFVGTWNTETTFSAEDGTGCEVWKTTREATYIKLDSFKAIAQANGSVLLYWETGSEIGTAGFHLYRSEVPEFSSFERITSKVIAPRGTPHSGAEYAILDKSVTAGTLYYYFLVEIDVNGKMSTFGPVQAWALIPQPEYYQMYSAIIQMDTLGV